MGGEQGVFWGYQNSRGVFRCPGLTLGLMRERHGGLMQAETGLPLFLYFRSEADANSPTPMTSCSRNQSGPVVDIPCSSKAATNFDQSPT